jgi:hypothetical protein
VNIIARKVKKTSHVTVVKKYRKSRNLTYKYKCDIILANKQKTIIETVMLMNEAL